MSTLAIFLLITMLVCDVLLITAGLRKSPLTKAIALVTMGVTILFITVLLATLNG